MIDLNPSIAADLLQTLSGYLDAGTGSAKMRFYTGPKPAPGAGLSDGQILIGSVNLAKPFANSINGAQLQPAPIPPMMIDTTGIVAWARFVGGDGGWVWDCEVGDNQSTKFIRIDGGLTVLQGGMIFITAGLLSLT